MDTYQAATISRAMTAHLGAHERAYTSAQVETAWRMLCGGKVKSGITRRDAEQLLRLFYPDMRPHDFERITGACGPQLAMQSAAWPVPCRTLSRRRGTVARLPAPSARFTGAIKGRLTLAELKALLQSDVLPEVRTSMPRLDAAQRQAWSVSSRTGTSSLAGDSEQWVRRSGILARPYMRTC